MLLCCTLTEYKINFYKVRIRGVCCRNGQNSKHPKETFIDTIGWRYSTRTLVARAPVCVSRLAPRHAAGCRSDNDGWLACIFNTKKKEGAKKKQRRASHKEKYWDKDGYVQGNTDPRASSGTFCPVVPPEKRLTASLKKNKRAAFREYWSSSRGKSLKRQTLVAGEQFCQELTPLCRSVSQLTDTFACQPRHTAEH